MANKAAGLATDLDYSDLLYTHINRYLNAITSLNLYPAINAVDALEDLLAPYYSTSYEKAIDGMHEEWDDLRERARSDGVKLNDYALVRKRFRALMTLAGERDLLAAGSPETPEI